MFQQAANENKQLEEELQKKTSSQNLSEPDQSGINLVLTGSSQYEQDTARENVENVSSENVISKSNGTVTTTTATTTKISNNQNGNVKPVQTSSAPAKTSSLPWKSSGNSNSEKKQTYTKSYKENTVSSEPVTVTLKDSGIEKAYQEVQNTAQSSSMSKMEPVRVSTTSFVVSSTVQPVSSQPVNTQPNSVPITSQNDEDTQDELPKSGTLVGLRSMFESQDTTKSSIPRSPSYSRDSKSNGSVNLPKSKSDNFTNRQVKTQQPPQQQQIKTSTSFQISRQSSDNNNTEPPTRRISQDNGNQGVRKGTKVPWYKQVSQMAYDGPSTITAVQNVRRSTSSSGASSSQSAYQSKPPLPNEQPKQQTEVAYSRSQPKQQTEVTNSRSWRPAGMGNTTVKTGKEIF